MAECNKPKVRELVQVVLYQGLSAQEILDEGLMKGMSIVGEMMEREEIMIPEVLDVAQFMSHINVSICDCILGMRNPNFG